jgi:hypothetical protein
MTEPAAEGRAAYMLDQLYILNPWIAYGLGAAIVLAAAEIGRLIGISWQHRHPEIMATDISMLVGAAPRAALADDRVYLFDGAEPIRCPVERGRGRGQCHRHGRAARAYAVRATCQRGEKTAP